MKKLISILSAAIMLLTPLTVSANSTIPDTRQLPRLVDNADILSTSEEDTLLAKLDDISQEHECDVVIVTVDSLDGKTATMYADDFYDYNGYGMGDGYSGILLLLSMEGRDYAVSTYGSAIHDFTDAGQNFLMNEYVLPEFKNDNWVKGFNAFADECDDFLTQAENGSPYDTENLPKGEFPFAKKILYSIVAGLAIAVIAVVCMKAQLKSVKMQNLATEYVRPNSMKVTHSNELYLYNKVSKTAIPKDNGGGSHGSSTHSSSSGRSHGGSSGKF